MLWGRSPLLLVDVRDRLWPPFPLLLESGAKVPLELLVFGADPHDVHGASVVWENEFDAVQRSIHPCSFALKKFLELQERLDDEASPRMPAHLPPARVSALHTPPHRLRRLRHHPLLDFVPCRIRTRT